MISVVKVVKQCLSASLGAAALSMAIVNVASATIVQFQTSLGNFEVNLYDEATPETVANFLAYVNDESYKSTIIHRSVSNFVIQGGGFGADAANNNFFEVTKKPAVVNEPLYSNVRGTIAMAKLSGDVNSATSQWFFNLDDNSNLDALDASGGGLFTAFGEVVDNGMDVVDSIAALPAFRFGNSPIFTQVPLRDYTIDDGQQGVTVEFDNYVVIENILVIDANKDTASDLSPVEVSPEPSPTPTASPDPTQPDGGSSTPSPEPTSSPAKPRSSGGGSIGFGLLLCLVALRFTRLRRR